MDLSALEAEHNALLCDKSGETEYTESLQDRINQMKVTLLIKNNIDNRF